MVEGPGRGEGPGQGGEQLPEYTRLHNDRAPSFWLALMLLNRSAALQAPGCCSTFGCCSRSGCRSAIRALPSRPGVVLSPGWGGHEKIFHGWQNGGLYCVFVSGVEIMGVQLAGRRGAGRVARGAVAERGARAVGGGMVERGGMAGGMAGDARMPGNGRMNWTDGRTGNDGRLWRDRSGAPTRMMVGAGTVALAVAGALWTMTAAQAASGSAVLDGDVSLLSASPDGQVNEQANGQVKGQASSSQADHSSAPWW